MIADCPTCGAKVEFRFDDSLVRVCDHCHSAVLRTDRGVETLGRFADLAPIDSALKLFADGTDGSAKFLLVGMAQLKHAQGGMWQEWYAKVGTGGLPPGDSGAEGRRGSNDEGKWGWLSEAQGRYYMTYEAGDIAAPAFLSLAPGEPVEIAGKTYTVGELGSATYESARGEIPYRLVPGAAFRFADLAAADGSFLTIDYGDPADAAAMPTVYVGRQMTLEELHLVGGEPVMPGAVDGTGLSRPGSAAEGQRGVIETKVSAAKIACPNCGGSLDVRAPGQTLRVACPYCGTMVSVESGAPAALTAKTTVPKPDLPLGTKGTFAEGELQIIGFVRRSAYLDNTWFPFDEYLLYAEKVGFRWLVCSDGHWSYVQPIAPGAVESWSKGWKYDGVKFRRFQDSKLRVDAVLGEMYWKVAVGETTQSEDSIAPPAMLSVERTKTEENWSLSSYLTPAQVRAALGQPELELPAPEGVGPNQPARSRVAAQVMSGGLMVMLVLGLVFAVRAPHATRFDDTITVPSGSAAPVVAPELDMPPLQLDDLFGSGSGSAAQVGSGSGSGSAADVLPVAYFSPPFHLEAGENIEIDFAANLNNDWAYAAADLVEDATGTVISVDAELESYSGFEDGESWSEGNSSSSEMIGPVPEGDYILRVESQHGSAGGASLRVQLYQGVFRTAYLLFMMLVLMIPYTLVAWSHHRFETTRWDNSTVDDSDKPKGGLAALIGMFSRSRDD